MPIARINVNSPIVRVEWYVPIPRKISIPVYSAPIDPKANNGMYLRCVGCPAIKQEEK